MRVHLTILALLIPASLGAQRTEDVGTTFSGVEPPVGSPTVFDRGTNVLYDNGPILTSVGTGSGGADESVLENVTLGMTTLGGAIQGDLGNSMADDMVVPAGQEWQVDTCTFFTYQTGAPTTSTVASATMRIWDGSPDDPGSSVIFGDNVTNVLTDTGFSNIFRIAEGDTGNALRAIFSATVGVDTVLTEGTYWIEWAPTGSASFSGPWMPPVTIPGQTTTGNGLQFFSSTWQPFQDGGTFTQLGMPFFCNGSVGGDPIIEVPTTNQYGLMALFGLLAIFGVAVLRRL